jgi:hypothetical protein
LFLLQTQTVRHFLPSPSSLQLRSSLASLPSPQLLTSRRSFTMEQSDMSFEPLSAMWLFAGILKALVFVVVSVAALGTRGYGQAPFAPSQLSTVARVRHYLFHKRTWAIVRAYHAAECAVYSLVALEVRGWPYPWPLTRALVLERAVWSLLVWSGSAYLVCHEKQPKWPWSEPNSEGEQELHMIVHARRGGKAGDQLDLDMRPGKPPVCLSEGREETRITEEPGVTEQPSTIDERAQQ